jgi:hypothetical protein
LFPRPLKLSQRASIVTVEERIYVQPHQIDIRSNEILCEIDGEYVPVSELKVDEAGIYVAGREVCPNGHRFRCGTCGGCLGSQDDCACKCR